MRLENFVIDARKPRHLAWRAEQFGDSEEALLIAIAAVGERADAVRAYLDEQPRQDALVGACNDRLTEL